MYLLLLNTLGRKILHLGLFKNRIFITCDQTRTKSNSLTGGAEICRPAKTPVNRTHQYFSLKNHSNCFPQQPFHENIFYTFMPPDKKKDSLITVLIIYLILIRSSDEYSLIYSLLYENSPLNLTELCFIQIRQSP